MSSSSSSVKCVEEGDEPIVRRKTVITIGSPPTNHSYDNETLTTSSSSTEVGETACGRITIQVKTIDNQHPHDDEVRKRIFNKMTETSLIMFNFAGLVVTADDSAQAVLHQRSVLDIRNDPAQ